MNRTDSNFNRSDRSSPSDFEVNFNDEFNFAETFLSLNKDRLRHASTCDIDLHVFGVPVVRPCHKIVLAKSFERFRTEFPVITPQTRPRYRVVKTEPFTNGHTFEMLLNLAYTGKLYVSETHVYDLLHDCLLFGYRYVDVLWKAIRERNYHTFRAVDFFFLFDQYGKESNGWFDTLQYIAEHINELKEDGTLLAVPVEKLKTMLQHFPRYMKDDEHILDLIVRWGERDRQARKSSIPELLETVHPKAVSGAFAKDLTAKLMRLQRSKYKNEWQTPASVTVGATTTLRTIVHMMDGEDYHFFAYELGKNGEWHYASAEIVGKHSASKFVRIRDHIYNIRAVADSSGVRERYDLKISHLPVMQYKDLLKVEWKKMPETGSCPIHTLYAAAVDEDIYIYTSPEQDFRDYAIRCFNLELNEWQQVSYHNSNLTSESTMFSHGGLLYLLGGRPYDGADRGYAAILHDKRAAKWITMPRMTHEHISGAACAHDGRIYVAGGMNSFNRATAAVEVYDIAAGRWDEGSAMREARDHFSLVPYNGHLWAIGNRHSLSTEVYHPRIGWEEYERSMVRARGDRMLIDLWPPEQRYADNGDLVSAFVLDTLVF